MNTQNISHNAPNHKGYIAIPEKFTKTFDKLKIGDTIYKIILEKGIIHEYEIVDIRKYATDQHEF